MSKTKAHIRYRSKIQKYKNGKGVIFPGTTTITNTQLGWNKKVLINWANGIGLKGIDSNKYVDEMADIGKLAHAIITNWLTHKETDYSDYTENQRKFAENSALSFYEWLKKHEYEVIFVEYPLISERWEYGGTIDIYWLLDGLLELTDLKSGGLWPEHYIQVGGGYLQLLKENKYKVEKVRILNIPRSEDEEFKDVTLNLKTDKYWQVFKCCRELYDLKKRF
jgi:hypothetical protein